MISSKIPTNSRPDLSTFTVDELVLVREMFHKFHKESEASQYLTEIDLINAELESRNPPAAGRSPAD